MTTGGIFRMKKGKRYAEAAKLVDRTKLYDVQEAVSVVKKAANAKFDETIEAHLRLGVDGRQAEQVVTDVMQTSRSVEQLYCLMEPVKKFVFLYLRKMQKQKKQRQQEQSMSEQKN